MIKIIRSFISSSRETSLLPYKYNICNVFTDGKMFLITNKITRGLHLISWNKCNIHRAFYCSLNNIVVNNIIKNDKNGLYQPTLLANQYFTGDKSKLIKQKRTNNYRNFHYDSTSSHSYHNGIPSIHIPQNDGYHLKILKQKTNILEHTGLTFLRHYGRYSNSMKRNWFSSTSNNDKGYKKSKSQVDPAETKKNDGQSDNLQEPAGPLYGNGIMFDDENLYEGAGTTLVKPNSSNYFIPQIPLSESDGRSRKRVLVLCTGGTLTMAQNPLMGGALSPVQGAVTEYMKEMRELNCENMPEIVTHEYHPFCDSSDLGPADWSVLANDIRANYLHFDGFVVLMGTDTMAYTASALSFMLENLGKPVVFTGSQIPLCEPYNDARRNLIMALIFASRDTINEVSIFFHDRLIRGCRSTKINTHRLMAFDSPNMEPLAKIGITIDENETLSMPPARGTLRVHSKMDTRLLTIRLVPGFDDVVLQHLVDSHSHENGLKTLVLQLYGTGNIPSVKSKLVKVLGDAVDKGILVVASTQCFTGSVMMGHYATGKALAEVGVISANDMTLEAISTKAAYLFGRGDLTRDEVANLMGVSLRGEVTPAESLPPPTLSTAYQRASRKGKRYY